MSPSLPCQSSSRQPATQDRLWQDPPHTPRSPFPEPEEPPGYETQQLTRHTLVLRVGMKRALVLSPGAGQELPRPPPACLPATLGATSMARWGWPCRLAPNSGLDAPSLGPLSRRGHGGRQARPPRPPERTVCREAPGCQPHGQGLREPTGSASVGAEGGT